MLHFHSSAYQQEPKCHKDILVTLLVTFTMLQFDTLE